MMPPDRPRDADAASHVQQPGSAQAAEERAEARAIRRRWITLGEIVAIAGLIIAALGLWQGWAGRQSDEATRRAEQAVQAKREATVSYRATIRDDGAKLALADPRHDDIAAVDLRFPRALGLAPRTGLIDPRIEADWIAAPLIAATDGGDDVVEGRVPVLIETVLNDGSQRAVDRAIYDVAFATHGRMLRGRQLRLTGLAIRARTGKDADAALDAAWAAESRRLASRR